MGHEFLTALTLDLLAFRDWRHILRSILTITEYRLQWCAELQHTMASAFAETGVNHR